MESRISIITLGVKDLARSYQFYKEGLGFCTSRKPSDGIVFFKTLGTCFALYPIDKLAEEFDPKASFIEGKNSPFTLAYNVRNKNEVEEILKKAKSVGAEIVKDAQDTFWGGYSGYFSDPDGFLWEVAWGAFDFNDDGSLIID